MQPRPDIRLQSKIDAFLRVVKGRARNTYISLLFHGILIKLQLKFRFIKTDGINEKLFTTI
jgi:hypothetical protein